MVILSSGGEYNQGVISPIGNMLDGDNQSTRE